MPRSSPGPLPGAQARAGHQGAAGIPQGPNQRWPKDFLSDALGDGRRFRILAIIDDCMCCSAGRAGW